MLVLAENVLYGLSDNGLFKAVFDKLLLSSNILTKGIHLEVLHLGKQALNFAILN